MMSNISQMKVCKARSAASQGVCIDDVPALNAMPDQRLLDEGFIDVTVAPFSANPAGERDSTQAIRKAVYFARHHRLAPTFQSASIWSMTQSSAGGGSMMTGCRITRLCRSVNTGRR
jgi:hypothetical protein